MSPRTMRSRSNSLRSSVVGMTPFSQGYTSLEMDKDANSSSGSGEMLLSQSDEKQCELDMELAWSQKSSQSYSSQPIVRSLILAGLACLALSALWVITQPRTLRRAPMALHFPDFAVGPRQYSGLYKGQCTSDEFLNSLKMATLRPDGASRYSEINQTYDSLALPAFEYSFNLAGCGEPHIFTPAEACDILSAFGGLVIQGDSYMRHVTNALFMLLRGTLSGATFDYEHNYDCVGNKMFNDKVLCRDRMVANSRDDFAHPTCGGAFDILYVGGFSVGDAVAALASFENWASTRQPATRLHSPILFAGFGIHASFNWDSFGAWFEAVPVHEGNLLPKALNLFAGIHHPGPNQPEQYLSIQGPQLSAPYNEQLQRHTLAQPPLIQGGFKALHFWNMTDGAESYDGVHYAYQVNMEKVQLLLNVLDIAWTDLVNQGGLISTGEEEKTSL